MAEDWIVVGQITAPQGVRGEVRVMPLTDFPERLQSMRTCFLRGRDGAVTGYTVLSSRPHKGFYLMRLEGVDSRDSAELLRGQYLVVKRADVVPLPEGRFYVFDLIGLDVLTTGGAAVGVVKDVILGPANDVYVVSRPGQSDALIPAVREIVRSIDLEKKAMVIEPMPGLLDEQGEDQE